MEIDFLISKPSITRRKNISPIEVKSSRQYSTASLDKFQGKYSQFNGQAYIIHPKDLRNGERIVRIPPYMTPLL